MSPYHDNRFRRDTVPAYMHCRYERKSRLRVARIVPTEMDAHSSNEKCAGAHILTRDEARRIAANIAKLAGLLLKRP